METFLILNGYELAADVDDATSTLRKISTKNSIARFYRSLLIPSVSQSAMLDIVFF